MKWVASTLIVSMWLVAGCDTNCQDTCSKIYDPAECNVQPGGITAQELIRTCQDRCDDALAKTGPMGDYNPFERRNPLDPKTIQNEKQAAAWMDCVAESSCEQLEPSYGLCEPI